MAPYQQSARKPLSEVTNLTISTCSRPCSSIGSSLRQIHDEVVESQEEKGSEKAKPLWLSMGTSTQAIGKLRQINRRKAQKSTSPYSARPAVSPRNAKKESSWNFTPPLDYIEKQRAYFAEIDALSLLKKKCPKGSYSGCFQALKQQYRY